MSDEPSTYGLWVMGSTARGLPFCAWDASQNQTRLPIPAFKVEKTTSDVESIWSRTITLVEIKLFNFLKAHESLCWTCTKHFRSLESYLIQGFWKTFRSQPLWRDFDALFKNLYSKCIKGEKTRRRKKCLLKDSCSGYCSCDRSRTKSNFSLWT